MRPEELYLFCATALDSFMKRIVFTYALTEGVSFQIQSDSISVIRSLKSKSVVLSSVCRHTSMSQST